MLWSVRLTKPRALPLVPVGFLSKLHGLRRRHAQLLREEVAQTVLNPDDVDAEVHALCEALVQAKGRVQV